MYVSSIPREEQLRKWAEYKALTAAVSERLMSLNNARLVERGRFMQDCARNIAWAVCPDCGTARIYNAYLCRDRLCPTCAWRLAMRRYSEMIQVFEATGIGQDDRNVSMLTLTMANMGIDSLDDAISSMLAGWSKLMKRRPVKKLLLGWARTLEITNKGRGYHPHIHALLVTPPGEFIHQRDWAEMWREAMDLDYTPRTDIRMSYKKKRAKDTFNITAQISGAVEALKGPLDLHLRIEGGEADGAVASDAAIDGASYPHSINVDESIHTTAAAQAMEYSFRPKMLGHIPQRELEAFALAIKDRRLVTFGGVIAEARRALKLKDDDKPLGSDIEVPLCPKCGAECSEVVYEWSMDSVQSYYTLRPE